MKKPPIKNIDLFLHTLDSSKHDCYWLEVSDKLEEEIVVCQRSHNDYDIDTTHSLYHLESSSENGSVWVFEGISIEWEGNMFEIWKHQ